MGKGLLKKFTKWWKGFAKESAGAKKGKFGALKILDIVADIYLVVSLFDGVKDLMAGDSDNEARQKESFVKLIFDPIVMYAMATEHRTNVVQSMLCNRGVVYMLHGNENQAVIGSTFITAARYLDHTDSIDDLYYSADDVKSIVKDHSSTELAEVVQLDALEEYVDSPDVSSLKGAKLIDYFAFWIESNGNDFDLSTELLTSPSVSLAKTIP
jgi:hypothetical protein